MQALIQRRMLHYGVAGLTSFLVEYGSFLGLYYLVHWSAVVSNSISFILSLITSFTLNKLWVFKSDQPAGRRGSHQFVLYCLVAAANLLVTDVAIHLLVALQVPAFVAKMLLIVLVAISNFFVYKRLIFKP